MKKIFSLIFAGGLTISGLSAQAERPLCGRFR